MSARASSCASTNRGLSALFRPELHRHRLAQFARLLPEIAARGNRVVDSNVGVPAIRPNGSRGGYMTKRLIAPGAVALLLGLAACTNPYDPAQRAVGGGLIGAGAGAAIGAAAGGGTGAAIGAATGGALGAITGVATTPPPPGYYP